MHEKKSVRWFDQSVWTATAWQSAECVSMEEAKWALINKQNNIRTESKQKAQSNLLLYFHGRDVFACVEQKQATADTDNISQCQAGKWDAKVVREASEESTHKGKGNGKKGAFSLDHLKQDISVHFKQHGCMQSASGSEIFACRRL